MDVSELQDVKVGDWIDVSVDDGPELPVRVDGVERDDQDRVVALVVLSGNIEMKLLFEELPN